MKKTLLLILILLISGVSFSQVNRITDRLQQKMMSINPLEYTRILIVFSDQVDIESLDKELYRINATMEYRSKTVIDALQLKARQTQGPVISLLKEEKDNGKVKEFIDFWVTNLIYAEVTNDIILELSRKNEIQMIDLDEKITYDKPLFDEYTPMGNATESSEPGLKVIKADLLWRLGITGVGRTVMHIDTGVD
ncbi:MAG: hypothetical protein KDD00_17635, partial [Ignavibacteriae bacterium]|nr:hypothetical protein [Ignavibacteriota bacterium]